MKKINLSQFIQSISKLINFLKRNQKKSILFFCLVLLGVFLVVQPARAEDFGDSILKAMAGLFQGFTALALGGVTFCLEFFLNIAKYNGYVEPSTQIVVVGWTLVRDVANMFFVVILLVIAFGTILGVENYQWNKLLGKLIFAAIFINFSKMICGLFIDVAYVFSLTFLNAIVNTAQGNILHAFHMTKLLDFSNSSEVLNNTGISPVSLAVSNFAAFMFAVMLLFTMGAYLGIMLARMVVLWLLIILSPLAFIFQIMPQTQEYAKQWWSRFTKQVLVLPVMTFFLWLTLATSSSGDIANTIGVGFEGTLLETTNLPSSLIEITSFNNMANFLVPFAIMIAGLTIVGQMGVVGGGLASKALDLGKRVGAIASGYALGRKVAGGAVSGLVGGAKTVTKFGLKKMPVIGGDALARYGKTIKSGASFAWSKVSVARDELAKNLESSSKERVKLQRDLRQATDPKKKAEIQKKIDELTASDTAFSSVGRFAKRFLALGVESSGRANKRAANFEDWARGQKEIEESNYSLSDTLGGDLKTRKNAEVVIARSNQESKAKTKLDKEVAFLYRKDKARIDALRREEQEARDALLRFNSSDHVNSERDRTNAALEQASSEQAQQEERVRKIQVEISVKQNEISKLGGNLNSDVVGGIVSLAGNRGVKLSLANLFNSLGEEDKGKVDALRKKWYENEHGSEGDYDLDSDVYKEQTGEALRQLLENGDIEGNYSFNTGLNKLFIDQFSNASKKEIIEIVKSALEAIIKVFSNIIGNANLNSNVVDGIVSLEGNDEVKLSLANLFDSLSEEDKRKVVALRKEWHGGEGDYDPNSDDYKKQTGEALRQLLKNKEINGNQDFNTGLNQLFVEQFPNQAIEIINKAQESQEDNELNRAQSKLQEQRKNYAEESKSLEESEKAKEKAIEEAEKWTPDNVENRRESLRKSINDPNTSPEQRAKDEEELSKLTGTTGSLEEITAAMARVDTIKAKQNNLVKSSFGLRAIYAREQAGVAAGDRAKAEAEALNIVQATDIGSQLVDALNEVEFGRKQAEEFAQTLKNQKLNKVLSGAAKTMEKVLTKWNKEGKGNLKELDRMLSEASAKNVFVGASVQSQKLEEAKSEGVQASKKVENWAGDLARNIPRGSRSPSTVMSSLLKETQSQFDQYGRVDGSEAAVKHIFNAVLKRRNGQELDLEDRRMAMGAWMKIDKESWNDDFFDAMVKLVQRSKDRNNKMTDQERNIAQEVDRFLARSGAKYNFDERTGKWKTDGEYTRDFTAMFQNLASTGGDVEAAIAHKKISEEQRHRKEEGKTGEELDYWKIAEALKLDVILNKTYAENQDYIQVATTEFRKNALANGHAESGLNQEFDANKGIYRFNTFLEAQAGMLTELSKLSSSELLKFQIHSWGDLDMNTGLLKRVSRENFAALTRNVKSEIDLRFMSPRTLAKLFDIDEKEQVDKSGGIAHLGGQKLKDAFTDINGQLDRAALNLHSLRDNILPKILGNTSAFGLMLKNLFELREDDIVNGTFKLELVSGKKINGIDGLVNEFRKLYEMKEITEDEFHQLLRIQEDWKKGYIIEPRTLSQKKQAERHII